MEQFLSEFKKPHKINLNQAKIKGKTIKMMENDAKTNKYIINSPVGTLQIECDDLFAYGIKKVESADVSETLNTVAQKIKLQLEEYFAGKRKNFDIMLQMNGTKFQKRVWEELVKIPFGETISYKELANRVGNKNASRAVGNANGKNPFIILVPCHRVVATNGLGGYSGGIEVKKFLLALEKSST